MNDIILLIGCVAGAAMVNEMVDKSRAYHKTHPRVDPYKGMSLIQIGVAQKKQRRGKLLGRLTKQG